MQQPLLGNAEAERVPFSACEIGTLTFVATASIVVLLNHAETSGVGLYAASFTGLQTSTGRAPLPSRPSVTHPHQHSTVFPLNSDFGSDGSSAAPTATVGKIAGLALGAVTASVLSLFNRLRVKAAPSHGVSLATAATAVLDPPSTKEVTGEKVYNKGIVTPEEAVNLPFTMAELREAIPKECFEKNLAWSLFYFARDWAIVGLLYHFQPAFFGLGILGKVLWWNIVGFYGWCLFVVGHDCGHGSFSEYGWLNQLLGHICHAPLCVPFNAWRISHRHHHQYHNDVDRDHSWRPSVAAAVAKLSAPIKQVRFSPFILLAYPYYLISNSQENGFSGCHFWPWNPLFKPEERLGVGMSALSVLGWLGVIAAATMQFGFWTVFQLYWIPYMIFVCWLDLVTLMQHTDKNAIFFRGEAWTYLRGAMSTIDRTYRHLIDPLNLGYGRIIDHLHHNISDGHVVHHIFFTQIPHYRLMAATEAIKPLLGKHYRYDDTPIPIAFWDTLKTCWFVDDISSGTVTYKGEKEYKQWEAQQRVQGLA